MLWLIPLRKKSSCFEESNKSKWSIPNIFIPLRTCVFIFWDRRWPELTVFRTLCVSSAFVDFVWRRGRPRCASLSRIISSFQSVCRTDADRGYLKPWSSLPAAALLLISPFFNQLLFGLFFFNNIHKSLFPIKCGARWLAVRWGCMRAAVWDYDLSAPLSWQACTLSGWAEQQRARSSCFNFYASSTIPAASGTFRTSGGSIFHPISLDTKQMLIIFY